MWKALHGERIVQVRNDYERLVGGIHEDALQVCQYSNHKLLVFKLNQENIQPFLNNLADVMEHHPFEDKDM